MKYLWEIRYAFGEDLPGDDFLIVEAGTAEKAAKLGLGVARREGKKNDRRYAPTIHEVKRAGFVDARSR